jgi:hypothetical protein
MPVRPASLARLFPANFPSSFCPALLVAATMVACSAGTAIAQPNLLTNPGAEIGSGSNPGTVADWVVGGSSNPGRENGTFNPGITPRTGSFSFYGNNGPIGTLTQRVDFVLEGLSLADIDAGRMAANIEFYTQSLDQGSAGDAASVTLSFFDSGGLAIGSPFDTGLQYNIGSWLQVVGSTAVPSGARFADYQMVFTRRVGSDNDAYFDDNRLTVAVPAPSAIAIIGLGGLMASRRRRR